MQETHARLTHDSRLGPRRVMVYKIEKILLEGQVEYIYCPLNQIDFFKNFLRDTHDLITRIRRYLHKNEKTTYVNDKW